MPVVTDSFYVPPDIQLGLDEGTLVRYGSVVRNTAGEIIKHLDPIDDIDQETRKHLPTGVKIVLGAFGLAALAGTGYLAYKGGQIICLNFNLNSELKKYLEEVRNGTLQYETIESLRKALLELREKKIVLIITQSNLDSLMLNYTLKLAKDNSLQVKEEALNRISKKDMGESLLHYLNIQEEIFEKAK